MWVWSCFDGDDNNRVMDIQHDEYRRMIIHLYSTLKGEYLNFFWDAEEDPELRKRLANIETFDHRVIQCTHDMIAASFRYLFCPHEEVVGVPEDFNDAGYLLSAWRLYYERENATLSRIREIQLPILTAIAYQNTEKGYEAEDTIKILLSKRYPYLYEFPTWIVY